MDKNMKLECMRRRQHALFGIAGRLIMVVSFAVGFCHFSPHSLANASFLMRRSTFRGMQLLQFRFERIIVFQRTVLG